MMNRYMKCQLIVAVTVAALGFGAATAGFADDVAKAHRMHRRLTGVNPSPTILAKMLEAIRAGNMRAAALAAIDNDENSAFYNTVAKSLVNRDFDEDGNLTPLSDGVALFIAMTRDDLDMRQFLFGNITAVGDHLWSPAVYDDPYRRNNNQPDPIRQPAADSNRHYEQMETRGVDLKKHLRIVPQTSPLVDPEQRWTGHTDKYPAGVFTTRAWASMYYNAGTNRAPIRFALKHYFCEDIDAWHDTTIPDGLIRRDPTRAPGGDPAVFVNKCKGCHAGMDPMTDAFAYLDWDTDAMALVFTKPLPDTPVDRIECGENADVTLSATSSYEDKLRCAVVPKFLNNKDTYAGGRPVVNDKWLNQWTVGNNARAGWPVKKGEKIFGEGPKDFGIMMAQSKAFPRCMAKRALSHICLVSDFANQIVQDKWHRLTDDFVSNGYKMKQLLAGAATMCAGD